MVEVSLLVSVLAVNIDLLAVKFRKKNIDELNTCKTKNANQLDNSKQNNSLLLELVLVQLVDLIHRENLDAALDNDIHHHVNVNEKHRH